MTAAFPFDPNCDCSDCKAYRARAGAQDRDAPPAAAPRPVATLLPGMSSEKRKEFPLVTGCLDYFPDALLAVAHVSYLGNQQHNPGKPIHWDRTKSQDEVDALGRHLTERGHFDEKGALIDAQVAWRALANLQKTLERLYGLPPARGSAPVE